MYSSASASPLVDGPRPSNRSDASMRMCERICAAVILCAAASSGDVPPEVSAPNRRTDRPAIPTASERFFMVLPLNNFRGNEIRYAERTLSQRSLRDRSVGRHEQRQREPGTRVDPLLPRSEPGPFTSLDDLLGAIFVRTLGPDELVRGKIDLASGAGDCRRLGSAGDEMH